MSDILHGMSTGSTVRDYQHANKIFVGNNYGLAPKYSFLFHVAFDINQNVSRLSNQQFLELGLLVKSAQIPKYTIDTKTLNAYNRPNIVQQKIKYDPVSITFHDDNTDTVRDFWYDYMSHYYRDSDYTPTTYSASHKYANASKGKNFWGYQPANYDNNSERLINSIKIYSLHQRKFSEYILVNPIITSFQHGQHQQGQSEFMENTMSIAYESVLYNYGTVKMENEPTGFATLTYDKAASPLSPVGGGTASIFGPGGLVNTVTGISEQLDKGPLGYVAAGLSVARTFNNLKGKNLLGMAGAELKNIGKGILQGDTNVLNRLSIPRAKTGNGTLSVQQQIKD